MTAQTWSLPVELQTGIHSARPAATAVGPGALFSCTTHSLVYQSDGATWTTWATLGGGSATITTKDEGSTLSTTVTTLDFVGSGVVASGSGATTTVTISGGGGGSSAPVSAAALILAYSLFK